MNDQQVAPPKKLLIVGPLPPPYGGPGVTIKAMMEELADDPSIKIEVINTSPYTDPRKKMTGFKLEKVFRMILLLSKYVSHIFNANAVLVFSNPLFTFTIVPMMLLVARCLHKPFYIKPVGGDLDLFIEAYGNVMRKFFIATLKNADGIFAQTKYLKSILLKYGCERTYYMPGFRSSIENNINRNGNGLQLRLIFLGYISLDKGPLVLLEALKLLSQNSSIDVTCDFYGLIHDDVREEFFRQLALIPAAHYRGVAEAGSGLKLIAQYDALVLPTFFKCEGHPGVIIEAMHDGVPVISTEHRSIPELITNGENGLLVPVNDSEALAKAIKWAVENRSDLEKMGEANKRRAKEFSTEIVVPQMLNAIFQSS